MHNILVRSRSPLRIGLAGGGTDISPYCDKFSGLVINATINKYTYASIKSAPFGKVIFHSIDKNNINTHDAVVRQITDNDLPLHAAIYRRMVNEFNSGIPLYITICTYSEVPAGSGLGSSSSLVVSMIQAFLKYLNIAMTKLAVASLAYKIEREDLGMHGGMQDHYAASFGGINCMEFYGINKVVVSPLGLSKEIISELEASIVLFFTGISRDSSIIIQDQINVISNNQDIQLEAMHSLKADALLMREFLVNGNIAEMGALLNNSWEKKKLTSRLITNKNIDDIYKFAINSGAYGGKISGAGGGGFFMFLVDPELRFSFKKKLLSKTSEFTVIDASFTDLGSMAWIK
jgi:D-glycero-alpha-D-manno-heptose-7-phosphate kinase